jgi:hypothetical protein
MACFSKFLPYRTSVEKLVLYQQHSIIRGDKPHRTRMLFRLPGDERSAATTRWFPRDQSEQGVNNCRMTESDGAQESCNLNVVGKVD